MGDPQPLGLNEFELTDAKSLLATPLGGRVALDYAVDGDDLYVGGTDGQIRFTHEGRGILRQEGLLGFEGRHVKLRK